jgi:hypothetical protein
MKKIKLAVCLIAVLSLWAAVANAQSTESPSCVDISRGSYDPSYAFEKAPPLCDITKGLLPPTNITPKPSPVAPVGFDQSTNKVFVNGFIFDVGDLQAAVESEKALYRPSVQMPSNYRPMGPEEYRGYVSNAKYSIKYPIRAYGKRILNSVKNHFRNKHREFQRYKKYVEAEIAKCSAIAERKHPADLDAQFDYMDECTEPLNVK